MLKEIMQNNRENPTSTIVTDCPRCDVRKVTFDLHASCKISHEMTSDGHEYETFGVCRECGQSTVFVLRSRTDPVVLEQPVTGSVEIMEYISQKHFSTHRPPEHLPEKIKYAFEEGANCLAVGCLNAACTMFRLCLDLTVHDEFKKLSSTKNTKKQDDVKKRILDMGILASKLDWLFDNGEIPANFRELADCIRNYGNDGAHQGNLREDDKPDVENLLGFTRQILKDRYTMQKNAALATERRKKRRSKNRGA